MVFNFTVSNLDCYQLTSHTCYAQKGKKARDSERQEGSMLIGFCNCARAAMHVALNILSVVDERLFAV